MLNGSYELPSSAERKARTERHRAAMQALYVPSRRHTMQLDFDSYMTELASETEAGRQRARHRAARMPRVAQNAAEAADATRDRA
jgi:hypothetical protein